MLITYCVQRYSFSIFGLGEKNATSAITSLTPSITNKIYLNSNNNTSFHGFADVTMNGKPMWSNVPVFVALVNGKLLNMSFDSIKTADHFTGIPMFGI